MEITLACLDILYLCLSQEDLWHIKMHNKMIKCVECEPV